MRCVLLIADREKKFSDRDGNRQKNVSDHEMLLLLLL